MPNHVMVKPAQQARGGISADTAVEYLYFKPAFNQ
jgi:hypothetical protein